MNIAAPAVSFAPRDSEPAAIPVLHLGEGFAVVDKPAGLMAHASAMARGEDDFLVDRLRALVAQQPFVIQRLGDLPQHQRISARGGAGAGGDLD